MGNQGDAGQTWEIPKGSKTFAPLPLPNALAAPGAAAATEQGQSSTPLDFQKTIVAIPGSPRFAQAKTTEADLPPAARKRAGLAESGTAALGRLEAKADVR